jgi:hypothetical protein
MGTQDFAPGLKMWTRQRATLFLSTSQNRYVLGGTNSDAWAGTVSSTLGTHATNQTNNTTAAGGIVLSFANQTTISVNDFIVVQVSSGDIFKTQATVVTPTSVQIFPAIPSNVTVGTGAYVWNWTVFGIRPLQLDFRTSTIVLRDINNNDTPLNFLTLQEYEALPNKAMPTFTSDPTAVYYESQFGSGLQSPTITGGGVLYLDAFPQDVTKRLFCVYLRPVMDLNNPSDNPEYPQQWYRALCWGLSREIAPMFDAEWSRESEALLQDSLSMAREQDSETSSLYFQPGRDENF